MADQCTLATKPNMQRLQTNTLLDWQRILDQLLDQSSIWGDEESGDGSGGPKEPKLVVPENTQASPNNF
jgi:hypothetical protein